jgi:hypothetical protein
VPNDVVEDDPEQPVMAVLTPVKAPKTLKVDRKVAVGAKDLVFEVEMDFFKRPPVYAGPTIACAMPQCAMFPRGRKSCLNS